MDTRISKCLRALLLVLSGALCALCGLSQTTTGHTTSSSISLPILYNAPAKGFVSLALYDKRGVLVRSLLYAEPVEMGKHTVLWDGTTDMGKAASAGAYTAKGVFFTTPPEMNFVMEVGKNGNPPWRTPDGKGDWGGNLGFPSSIVSNSHSLMMTYAAVEDNQITGIQQMDGDGTIQKRYFSFYPWDTRMAGAMDDTSYYLGILNTEKNRIEIAQYTLGEPRGKILTVLPTQPHQDQHETRWRGRFTAWLDGLALTKDTLFASIGADDVLFLIDRTTGQIRTQIPLPSPRGLAVYGEHLFAISGGRVLRLSLNGQIEATLAPAGVLKSPFALAIDRAGNLYVGDGGEVGIYGATEAGKSGTRQVYVFSAEGKLLHKIGKPGGSPEEGHFDKDGLGIIISLCIAPDGKSLWVNDIATGFHRTSRWSLDGKLQRQWFGRKLALFSDLINPARPSELLFANDAFTDEPGISAYEMDIAHKTWQPSWHYDTTWNDMYQEDVYLSFTHGGNPLNGPRGTEARWPVFDYATRNFVTYHGRNYFMNTGGNGDGAIFLYSPDHKPKPVALVGNHRVEKKQDGKIESIYDQGPNNWFTWADRNGDGKMQREEILFTANPALLATTARLDAARLDDHLNVVMKRRIKANGKEFLVDSMLPLKELLPNGAPVYDWSQLRDLVPLQTPDLTGGDGKKTVRDYQLPMPLETEDSYYSMVSPEPAQSLTLPGIDGQGWWASRNWRTKVARFDKQTGLCLWAVGRRAPGKAQPGQMYHPVCLAGVAQGAVFVADTLGPIWVWNQDGLYLGNMAHDFGADIQDDRAFYGEIQATTIYTDLRSGKIYSIANDTGAHIHEIVLPKTTPLNAGTITLSGEQAALAQAWDPDGLAPTEHPRIEARFVSHPMMIDGDLRDWYLGEHQRMPPPSLILMDGQRLATIRALYDTQNLYLAYEVSAPNGTLNAGSELPFAPFVSGAYVDFCIAPNWQGTRSAVREGDLRVILACVKEGDQSIDFQQGFWQIRPGGENGRTLTSPAATVHFDQIQAVPGLKMAYKVGAKDPKTGLISYTVEVAVPLSSLGLNHPAGMRIGFDASVGIADAAGDRRERAAHWGGLSEAFVVDRPGSSVLLPATWGTLVFESIPNTR